MHAPLYEYHVSWGGGGGGGGAGGGGGDPLPGLQGTGRGAGPPAGPSPQHTGNSTSFTFQFSARSHLQHSTVTSDSGLARERQNALHFTNVNLVLVSLSERFSLLSSLISNLTDSFSQNPSPPLNQNHTKQFSVAAGRC